MLKLEDSQKVTVPLPSFTSMIALTKQPAGTSMSNLHEGDSAPAPEQPKPASEQTTFKENAFSEVDKDWQKQSDAKKPSTTDTPDKTTDAPDQGLLDLEMNDKGAKSTFDPNERGDKLMSSETAIDGPSKINDKFFGSRDDGLMRFSTIQGGDSSYTRSVFDEEHAKDGLMKESVLKTNDFKITSREFASELNPDGLSRQRETQFSDFARQENTYAGRPDGLETQTITTDGSTMERVLGYQDGRTLRATGESQMITGAQPAGKLTEVPDVPPDKPGLWSDFKDFFSGLFGGGAADKKLQDAASAEKLAEEDVRKLGEDPKKVATDLIGNNRVLGVGETHDSADAHREHLASLLPDLKAAGATHFATELGVQDQPVLDELMRTGKLDPSKLPDSHRDPSYIKLLESAHRAGLKLVAVDARVGPSSRDGTSDRLDAKDLALPVNRDRLMADRIGDVLREDPSHKVVFEAGSRHLMRGDKSDGVGTPYYSAAELLRGDGFSTATIRSVTRPDAPDVPADLTRPVAVRTDKAPNLGDRPIIQPLKEKNRAWDYSLVYPRLTPPIAHNR